MNKEKKFAHFSMLNASQCISLIGSGLTDFALTYYILQNVMQSSGRISQYTILYVFMYLPAIIVAPFIGTLVDKSNRKFILISSDTIAALGSLAILLLYVNNSLAVYHIYFVVLIKALASAFQAPAFQSSIAVLVDKDDYGRAAGLAQVGESINKIISPLLAGVLFYYMSLESIIMIDFICYFIALIFMLPCKMPELTGEKTIGGSQFFKDCWLGFELIRQDKVLISLLAMFVLNNFFISCIQVLVQPLVYVMNERSGMIQSNAVALGIIMTCGGVGMMISSIAIGVKGGPKNKIASILILNGCGGLILMLVIAVKSISLFAIGTLAYFMTIPFILGSNFTIWQKRVPVEHQGKVFSIRRSSVLAIIPLSSLIAGGVVDGINNNYESFSFLHGILGSPDSIYSFLFFIIGFITIITSVVFRFNKHLIIYQKEWRGGMNHG